MSKGNGASHGQAGAHGNGTPYCGPVGTKYHWELREVPQTTIWTVMP